MRAAYPGFTGTRPRMQLWHGTTDDTVNIQNFREEIKEWTNVLGVSETPTSTENNAIQSTWLRTRYTDSSGVVQIEAIEETGQPHNLVVNAAEAIHFFGLDGSNPVSDAGPKDSPTDTNSARVHLAIPKKHAPSVAPGWSAIDVCQRPTPTAAFARIFARTKAPLADSSSAPQIA